MLFGRKNKKPIKINDKGAVEWKYTTCGYCSNGCSIEVGLNKDGKAVSARGVGDADVNRGKLCIKGIFEYELFETEGRGRVPLVRDRSHQPFQQASWNQALDKVATAIQRIQDSYSRDAFAIVSTGQIKGLWLIATNPMTSMPNTARIRKTLEKLEFLVVQDAYADVETNEYSHVFLPAAIWAEKEGGVYQYRTPCQPHS